MHDTFDVLTGRPEHLSPEPGTLHEKHLQPCSQAQLTSMWAVQGMLLLHLLGKCCDTCHEIKSKITCQVHLLQSCCMLVARPGEPSSTSGTP